MVSRLPLSETVRFALNLWEGLALCASTDEAPKRHPFSQSNPTSPPLFAGRSIRAVPVLAIRAVPVLAIRAGKLIWPSAPGRERTLVRMPGTAEPGAITVYPRSGWPRSFQESQIPIRVPTTPSAASQLLTRNTTDASIMAGAPSFGGSLLPWGRAVQLTLTRYFVPDSSCRIFLVDGSRGGDQPWSGEYSGGEFVGPVRTRARRRAATASPGRGSHPGAAGAPRRAHPDPLPTGRARVLEEERAREPQPEATGADRSGARRRGHRTAPVDRQNRVGRVSEPVPVPRPRRD